MIVTKTNDDLIKYIEDIKRETNSQDYSEIFSSRSKWIEQVSSKSDIYQKGTPIHKRGKYCTIITFVRTTFKTNTK